MVQQILKTLQQEDYRAYAVGGCVRDLLLQRQPKDWDIATDAKPDAIEELFDNSFINNDFGTVTVVNEEREGALREIEITPFRVEEQYSDKRHPDQVEWTSSIEDDLSRRDFTINAMAMDLDQEIIDPFDGRQDLEQCLIKAVGDPQQRFAEDALRMMRAVRFYTTLDFKIGEETQKAIKSNAEALQTISNERIRDELMKMINSERAAYGIEKLRQLELLQFIIPELEENFGVPQNKHHVYGCYEHAVRSLHYAARQDYSEEVRLASLLHDVGKPQSKEGQGEDATFYNHEVISADLTKEILKRLRFPKDKVEKVTKLVRHHLFYYTPEEVGESSVRRLIRKVGLENMDELIQVRKADRIGSGVPKAEPYKLRHLRYVVDKVSQDPISTDMLEVSGDNVMELLDIEPGPKVGQVLTILLGKVLEDPQKNEEEFLKKQIEEMKDLSGEEIEKMAQKAKEKRDKIKTKRDEMLKEKYWVQ